MKKLAIAAIFAIVTFPFALRRSKPVEPETIMPALRTPAAPADTAQAIPAADKPSVRQKCQT